MFIKNQEACTPKNPVLNEENLSKYQKIKQLADELFKGCSISYVPEDKVLNIHSVFVRSDCFEIEGNELMKKLGEIFMLSDSTIIDCSSSGESTCITIRVDNIYEESR